MRNANHQSMINLQDQEGAVEDYNGARPQTAVRTKQKAVMLDNQSIHDFDS